MSETGAIGLHATAVLYGENGVLILGPSGSGKSGLALALLARARLAGAFGALIGDDRVYLRRTGDRLVMSGAAHMAGLIERRAAGLLSVARESAGVLRLAVDLSATGQSWPRMPEEPDVLTLLGVPAPRLALNSNLSANDQAVAIDERLALKTPDRPPGKRISLEQFAAVHKNRKVSAMAQP